MANRRLKIGFDIDDVLFTTVDYSIAAYNSRYGTHLTRNNWYNFDPDSLVLWGANDIPLIVSRVAAIFGSDGARAMVPIRDSLVVLRKLEKAGHELFAITGRPESLRSQTLRLLHESFSGIFTNETLFFVDHFNHDGEKATKADTATKLGLTHFVDDQIEHVNGVSNKGVSCVLFGDNYKWNRGVVDEGVKRLTNWQEIEAFFDCEQVK